MYFFQVLKKVMELSPNTVLWVILSGVIAAGTTWHDGTTLHEVALRSHLANVVPIGDFFLVLVN
jgi:hypothetical protein